MKRKELNKIKPDKCPGCKKKVPLTFGSDAYSVEICDDHTSKWLCDKCRSERAEEV